LVKTTDGIGWWDVRRGRIVAGPTNKERNRKGREKKGGRDGEEEKR
jgi:hypothetical protein